MKAILPLLLLVAGCNACGPLKPGPLPPPSPQPVPVTDGGIKPDDACQAEADALERMHCAEWSLTYAADCRTAEQKLRELPGGHAPLNHSCVIGSPSCEGARKCRQ
jgi:hypothetical protein